MQKNTISAQSYFDRANKLYEDGEYQDAAILYALHLENKPDHVDCVINLANTYRALNEPVKALELTLPLFENGLADGDFLFNIGNLFSDCLHWDKASFFYCKAIEANPEDSEFYLALGVSLLKLKQFDEAVNALNIAIERGLKSSYTYLLLGDAVSATGDKMLAIKYYSQAVNIDPTDAECYFNRALDYIDLGEARLAINDLTKAISISPGYSDAYAYRAIAHELMNNTELAQIDWARARELGSECTEQYSDAAAFAQQSSS